MCPNIWENENIKQKRYMRATYDVFMSNIGKTLAEYNGIYEGSLVFNSLLNQVPIEKRAENFIDAANTVEAMEQTRRNGLWANIEIQVNGKQQYVSPAYSEAFLVDGRIGYITYRNYKKGYYKCLIIDEDYVLREYQFEHENNPALGYCLIKYKTP